MGEWWHERVGTKPVGGDDVAESSRFCRSTMDELNRAIVHALALKSAGTTQSASN